MFGGVAGSLMTFRLDILGDVVLYNTQTQTFTNVQGPEGEESIKITAPGNRSINIGKEKVIAIVDDEKTKQKLLVQYSKGDNRVQVVNQIEVN